jgi:uncharacterized membrane protein SpoIIM required for sporulation
MPDAAPSTPVLRSYEFRRQREPAWQELEELVGRVDRFGLSSLRGDDLMRLPVLYRAALSSLAVARSISLDKNATDYLESLVGRAYLCVYSTKRGAWEAVRAFFGTLFPRAVRRYAVHILLAIALTAGATAIGYQLVKSDPDNYYMLVDEQMSEGRTPAASTEDLRDVLYEKKDAPTSSTLTAFATFLFTHNSKIAMLCFALGFVLGLPVIYLLVQNGLLLGAMAALYQSRGLGLDFWGWILPHGITELGAICLCGGAGLAVAQAILFPGRHKRLENLVVTGREVVNVVAGAVVMLLCAGLIEGIFRQRVDSIVVRYALASATLLFWLVYLGVRRPSASASVSAGGPRSAGR